MVLPSVFITSGNYFPLILFYEMEHSRSNTCHFQDRLCEQTVASALGEFSHSFLGNPHFGVASCHVLRQLSGQAQENKFERLF